MIRRQVEGRRMLPFASGIAVTPGDIAEWFLALAGVCIEWLLFGLCGQSRLRFLFCRRSAGLIFLRKNFSAAQIFVRVDMMLAGGLLFAGALLASGLRDVLRVLC